MNDGGSALGGNQSTSGGADAPILNNPIPPTSVPPTSVQPNPVPPTPVPSAPASTITPSPYPDPAPSPQPSPSDDAYEQEFLESLHSPDSIVAEKTSSNSKKGLIIAVVIAAVVLIGVSVVAFLSFSKTTPSPVSSTQTSPYAPPFYAYANNLLYGSDSTSPIGDPEEERYYSYEEHIYNGPESDQTYINQIYNNYLDFYTEIPSSETELYNIATDYKQLLDFIKINPSSNYYNYISVVSNYLNKGDEDTKDYIEKNLSRIPNNKYSQEFRSAKEQEFNNMLQYLEELDEAGCISDRSIDEECSMDFELENYPSDDENPRKLALRLNSETYDKLNTYFDQIGSECWKIKEVLEVSN